MNSSPSRRSYTKMLYGPSQEKTLHNLLKRELVINFGFENKLKIADVLIDSMLSIIDNYGRDVEKMQPYQILWPAVDKNDFPGYGKSMDKIKHHSVVLTLWTKDELEELANGANSVKLMKQIGRAHV